MKYVCKMKKEDILKVIVEQFEEINADYSKSMITGQFVERHNGKYQAMMDLLGKLKIEERD